jgi:hypothetical protein
MASIRSVLGIGILAIPFVGFGYVGYCLYTFDRINHQFSEIGKLYQAGTLDELPGPYLPEGNSHDISFKVDDLGNGRVLGVSEHGDCLMAWYGDKPSQIVKEQSDHAYSVSDNPVGLVNKLFKSNGVVEALPSSFDLNLTLTASGQVVMVRSGKGTFDVRLNNHNLLNSSSPIVQSDQNLRFFGQGVTSPLNFVTDDGIFSSSSTTSIYQINGSENSLIATAPAVSFTFAESTSLGTILIHRNPVWTNPQHGASLSLVKSGKVTLVELPNSVWSPYIKATKSSFLLKDENDWKSKLWKYESGTFTQLPIPKGIYRFSIAAANSRGDILLSVSRKAPELAGKQYPYREDKVLITRGKCYDIGKELKDIGADPQQIRSTALDDSGHVFMQLIDHDYQMRVVKLTPILAR